MCTKCPVNTISQQIGTVVCVSCAEGEVSNENRDSCSESYESFEIFFVGTILFKTFTEDRIEDISMNFE